MQLASELLLNAIIKRAFGETVFVPLLIINTNAIFADGEGQNSTRRQKVEAPPPFGRQGYNYAR